MDNGGLAEAALDEDKIDANLCGSFPAGFVMPKVGISSSHYPVREHPLKNSLAEGPLRVISGHSSADPGCPLHPSPDVLGVEMDVARCHSTWAARKAEHAQGSREQLAGIDPSSFVPVNIAVYGICGRVGEA